METGGRRRVGLHAGPKITPSNIPEIMQLNLGVTANPDATRGVDYTSEMLQDTLDRVPTLPFDDILRALAATGDFATVNSVEASRYRWIKWFDELSGLIQDKAREEERARDEHFKMEQILRTTISRLQQRTEEKGRCSSRPLAQFRDKVDGVHQFQTRLEKVKTEKGRAQDIILDVNGQQVRCTPEFLLQCIQALVSRVS